MVETETEERADHVLAVLREREREREREGEREEGKQDETWS